jgi:hypothetical protein
MVICFKFLQDHIFTPSRCSQNVIVDITPQLITLNQRSKSDKYHKNKHSSIQIFTKIVLIFFVPKSRSPIPKGHFRHMISKCEIHNCL